MDFDLPGEDDPRRQKVRAWFDAHPNASFKELAEAGYSAPHWPAPWGLDADPELQLIITQEAQRAHVVMPIDVNPVAVNQCGQTVVNVGTQEQQERYLPPALACEETWVMLFSEPSGGSDLASARTVAKREGDHFIVNGQKIWNSGAHRAQVGILLARTDPTVPKHQGLTAFIIDMDTPGIEVRRITDMTGYESEFNEVFFTDVKIPPSAVLGEVGGGWGIVLKQLQTERMGMTNPGAVWGHGPTARELVHGLAGLDHGGILARHRVLRAPHIARVVVVGAQFPLGNRIAECRARPGAARRAGQPQRHCRGRCVPCVPQRERAAGRTSPRADQRAA